MRRDGYRALRTEQHHFEKSPYRFSRETRSYHDTIHNNGMGEPVAYTGMTWSGFRPSDDACGYGYLVASNMFAVVELGHLAEMLLFAGGSKLLIDDCLALRDEIDKGIRDFAVVQHEKYGSIYACEVNGMGDYYLFDDANVRAFSPPPISATAPQRTRYTATPAALSSARITRIITRAGLRAG